MNARKTVKDTVILFVPLLLFAFLIIPYSWLNQEYIVEWFGCGCPKIDSNGNMIEGYFNANDFTALFWLFVSVCATVLAWFLSKRITKTWLRVIYTVAILIISFFISSRLHQLMMWN